MGYRIEISKKIQDFLRSSSFYEKNFGSFQKLQIEKERLGEPLLEVRADDVIENVIRKHGSSRWMMTYHNLSKMVDVQNSKLFVGALVLAMARGGDPFSRPHQAFVPP